MYYVAPFLIMALYVGLFLGRFGHFCIRQNWIAVIGGMCYTIYLYHFMIINLLVPWTIQFVSPERAVRYDLLLQCVILYPVVILVSAILFVLIEKPFMKLSRRAGELFRRAREARDGQTAIVS